MFLPCNVPEKNLNQKNSSTSNDTLLVTRKGGRVFFIDINWILNKDISYVKLLHVEITVRYEIKSNISET